VNWRKWAALLLLLLSGLSLYVLSGQWKNFRALQGKLSTLEKLNEITVKENRELKEEVLLLRDDPRYIEQVARQDLGMVRQDDRVYRFVSPGDD